MHGATTKINIISVFYTKPHLIVCSSQISTHITGLMDVKEIYKPHSNIADLK
jgi:hypothetical protein